jgi:hypothetical protein
MTTEKFGLIIISVIVSIIANFFMLFSPSENVRAYNTIFTSTVSIEVALIILLW